MEQAAALIDRVGLGHRQRHRPAELSGGEQQRVALARAIAGEPSVVLADEPTGDLDASSAEGVMQLMQDLNHDLGITFVVATHNECLARLASLIFHLENGRLLGP